MSRKVYVDVTVSIIINIPEDRSVQEVLDNMDYNMSLPTSDGEVLDTEITDYEITDSK